MYWNWKIGGVVLGLAFLLAVALVKPIGVSTQFVILDGMIANVFNAELIIESEESKFFLEVTIKDKLTGAERTSAITFDSMTGFTSAGTVDIACRAGVLNTIATFEVPSNQQYILGRKDGQAKVYAYLGDNQ